jgi:hypothetical protein
MDASGHATAGLGAGQFLGRGGGLAPGLVEAGLTSGGSGLNLQIHFKNVELIRILNDLKKKEPQVQQEAAKRLHQYMSQY